LSGYDSLVRLLGVGYDQLAAAECGPKPLKAFRELLIADKITRQNINEQIRTICRVFKHGVSRELIDGVTGRLNRDHLGAPLVPFEIGGLGSSGLA